MATYEQVTYNSPDGAQVGNSAATPLAFFGATPAVQPSGVGQAVPTDLASCIVWITKVRLDLIALGLIKGAA